MFLIIQLIYFMICGVLGFILWFRMLGILKSKGQKINYLWITPWQFISFYKTIKKEKDLTLKKKYQVLLWIQIVLIPIIIIGEFIIMGFID
jgi:hypothetical protein